MWDLQTGARLHRLDRAPRWGDFRGGEPATGGTSSPAPTTGRWRCGTSRPARGCTNSTGHQGGVSSVAVSPDGRHIVSGSDDKTVAVWDLETGARLHDSPGIRVG